MVQVRAELHCLEEESPGTGRDLCEWGFDFFLMRRAVQKWAVHAGTELHNVINAISAGLSALLLPSRFSLWSQYGC